MIGVANRTAVKRRDETDDAHLAAIKLRTWIGDTGVYARLFDGHTTARLDNNWLYFNVEGLSDDPRLETAAALTAGSAS